MSKFYVPALALALVGTGAYAQSSTGVEKANKRHDGSMIVSRAPRTPAPAAVEAREIIWSDDFSDPGNWIPGIVDGASDDTWVIGTTGPTGPYAAQVGTIASTTASNGFALFDSDLLCSGNQNATLTLANPVDLSAYSGVLLQFEENYKRFYDNTWVDWSTNGVDWASVQVNGSLEHGGTASPTANPELVTINLSDLAGWSTAYIRFRFESTPTSVDPLTNGAFPATLVGCAYSWMVDDVAFITLPDYEIQMNYAYTSTTGTGEEYGRIPTSQLPTTMNVGAELFNLGVGEQTNVSVDVTFSDANGNPVAGYDNSVGVAPMQSGETVVADDNINYPTTPGLYNVAFLISSDNIAEDFDNTNNAAVRNYEVTNDVYSIDAIGNHPEGTEELFQYGTPSWTDNAEVYYMSMYVINSTFQATGVTVELGSGTVAGDDAVIEAFLVDTIDVIQTPATVSNWINGVSSGPHVVTAADVATGTIGLQFEEAVNLDPGAYFAVVRLAGSGTVSSVSSTDAEVYILDDNTVPQPPWTSAIFLPIDFNDDGTEGRHSYTNGNAYAIRLTSNTQVGVQEMTELAGVSIFPNPTNGVFQIRSDRTDVLFVEVTDALGKVVHKTNFSALATVDLSDLAAGVYSVAVSSANERSVQRVTIK